MTPIDEAARQLANAGVPSPRVDAELLAAHVRGVRRGVEPGWTPEQLSSYSALVVRRAAREPLQHLVGSVGFRHLELAVGPGVFIPRPETEWVAQAGLDAIAGVERPVVLDLCSGSGAIALSVAQERPDATVWALERDTAAVGWLRRNRDTLGLERVRVRAGDVAAPIRPLAGAVDLVISNPPYVEPDAVVDPEVEHDPPLAVWGGGDDGLDVVRVVIAVAAKYLRPLGFLVVEHSERQGAATRELAAAAGLTGARTGRDLAGRDRWLAARAPA